MPAAASTEELFIFARFHARPGQEAAVAAAIRAVLPPTADEPGCLSISAYRGSRDGKLFYIHSRWVDEMSFERHAGLSHTRHFLDTVAGLLDHPADITRSRELG
jgi:quinol monooxygenase YgiN